MIRTKTDAGRAEIQRRDKVTERVQRNLLLLVDGKRSDAELLASVTGSSRADLDSLEAGGLIVTPVPVEAPAPAGARAAPRAASSASPVDAPTAFDYPRYSALLTRIIARDLGLLGFRLTLAVERAGTAESLREVAERTLEQIARRKGEAAAAAARSELGGG